MKRGRIGYQGQIRSVINTAEGIQLPDGTFVNEHEVTWLPPLDPKTSFALGLNYADHASELEFKAPTEPLVFLKGPNTFVGHRGITPRPADAANMHYECELVAVIGREAKHVKQQHAYEYISGYTVANDYAIRDYLENYYRPNLRVKNRDACTPIGPWIVDAPDIEDPMNLQLRTYVNGEVTQEGTTKDMIFSVPFLIEYLSSFMTLSPGDIILTGTPKGAVNIHEGDEVVTEIEGIGKLHNTIGRLMPAP
ncbi:fumarylacetoacetate hydrolase family protein [Alicyclobacillus sp. SO9]|uniref:fumarylacetoacetate hydrolase family protein n=1 Tax=Alicyclobacillus sp. SO9 TaxID=2665646 RepID=UPI001E51E22B|nr:fumarylacetoacetate hydrolase family protein [Alicyclobacillus sp. SO9]